MPYLGTRDILVQTFKGLSPRLGRVPISEREIECSRFEGSCHHHMAFVGVQNILGVGIC